jgi:hypothetical protein
LPTDVLPSYSTHDVFAILSADTGGSGPITAVTDFTQSQFGRKQIMMWDLRTATGPNGTYGTAAVTSGGSNDRRIFMSGINPFSGGTNGTNLPGADIAINADGTLCAFVTRENRELLDGTIPAAIVYYLNVARLGPGIAPNQVKRINCHGGNSFGSGLIFAPDMTIVPGMWFPQNTPNNGMRNRLVFTVATVANVTGTSVSGQHQNVFTADIPFTSGGGLDTPIVYNRTNPTMPQPFLIDATTPSFNYFGGFPSRTGHTLFLINADNADLMYLDLRDGLTSPLEPVINSHNQAPMKLPARTNLPLLNTYLPPGFEPDPNGEINLEHWGNQMFSLHGPGLNQFNSEYLFFVSEETAGAEDVYVLQMNSLTSPLPSPAINLSNIPGAGAIKAITPSRDGAVVAFVKGAEGFKDGYRFTGAIDGELYVVADVPAALNANATTLTTSATVIPTLGNRISRSMGWFEDPARFTLYYGEGSTQVSGTPPSAKSFLQFHRLDLDRSAGNTIGTPIHISQIGITAPLVDGAIYIYGVGKQE